MRWHCITVDTHSCIPRIWPGSPMPRFNTCSLGGDHFCMRIRKTDGSQPYAVLSQLPQYSSVPLRIGLNQNTDYYTPLNIPFLMTPYLYLGFLPDSMARRRRRRRKFIRQSNQHSTKCKWRNEWLATKEGKPIELVAKIMECIIKLNNASHSWIIQINH